MHPMADLGDSTVDDAGLTAQGVVVTPASASDAQALSLLHASGFDDPWSPAAFETLFALSTSVGWLAHCQELTRADGATAMLVAAAAVGEAEILTVAVAPGARCHGLGAMLVNHFITWARGAGLLRLHLEVADDNFAARRLYARAGFTETGRRPGYYRRANGPPRDAVVMSLDLGAAPQR